MKLHFLLSLLLFLLPFSNCDGPSALEKALNPNPNPYCTGDCRVLKKMQAIFPLRGQEKNIDTQLNFFNWKQIFVFSDHMSIYSASQTSESSEKPQEVDFLNNLPFDDIQTPCNNYKDVCTVAEFKDQMMKPINREFVPNQKAMDSMGKDLWHNCLVISEDLLEVNDMSYVCSKNLEDFQALQRIFIEMVNKYEGKEFVGRLYMISEKKDDLVELNGHIDSSNFVGNNMNEEISSGAQKDGYKEYFTFALGTDIVSPAYTLLKDKVKLDWKGDEAKKPEAERCFGVMVSATGKSKEEKIFCVFTTNNGSISLNVTEGFLEAVEWVIQLNRRHDHQKVKTAQEALKSLTGEISPNSPQLDPAKNEIHELASKVEKDCQEKVKQGVLDQRNCDEMKKKVVAEKAVELCAGNKECLKAIKEAIKTGALPLTSKGDDLAWSPNNPYKAAASQEAAKNTQSQQTTSAGQGQTTGQTTSQTTSQIPLGQESLGSSESDTGKTAESNNPLENLLSPSSGDKQGTGGGSGADSGDHGQTVMTQFGADKGKDLLNKELTNNEVPGGSAPAGSTTGGSKANEASQKAAERLNGILSDIGLTAKEGKKIERPTVRKETGQPAPEKDEIQKALNTYARIFYGRDVDKIEGVEKYCIGNSLNLGRVLGILPFTSLYEPFLDYFGYIRDVQSQK